jgi:hypothetical protein
VASVNPTAVVWYKSRVLQGLLAIVVSQITSRLVKNYGIDMMGLSTADIVSWIMDAISAAGVYIATHARVAPSVPIPPVVTGTQAAADAINSKGTPDAKAPDTPAADASKL